MGRFADEVVQRMRHLRLMEKLPVVKVVDVMKEHGVKASDVYYYCAPEKKAAPKQAKSAPKKQRKVAAPVADTSDTLHGLVDQLVAECAAYTQFAFRRARRQIMQHIAETRAKRVQLGEDVPLLDKDDVA